MKIPKAFHPILGIMTGAILFLAGIAVSSLIFVGTYKAVQFAKPYLLESIKIIHEYIHHL